MGIGKDFPTFSVFNRLFISKINLVAKIKSSELTTWYITNQIDRQIVQIVLTLGFGHSFDIVFLSSISLYLSGFVLSVSFPLLRSISE